ncbi:MAG: SPOR domain-containing protein [Sphingopyxis sp.]|nr:SPOR domain-containing protein [Sphingopyxis sp.]
MINSSLRQSGAVALAMATAICAFCVPPARAQVAEPDPIVKAALEKRRDAEASLASAMGRIGNDRTDATALIDAGRASLALDNPQAALGFLTRAGQLRPADGTVAALTASAMVQLERPAEALDLFANAARLGAPERSYLSDRGLALDLLGRQDDAQRDYEAVLSQANDPETVRRYALSLGISGQVDRAVQVLTPQLRSQDRAAWRTRAMIYAFAGRQSEAQEIVKATLPGPMASNIIPFLARLPGLTPAQKAAAAHFGALPGGTKPGIPGTARPAPTPTPKPTPPPVVIAARPVPTIVPAPANATRTPAPTPAPATVPTAALPAAPPPPRRAGPSADLAAVMAGLAVPDNELAPAPGALDMAALEAVKAEQRRAAEAEADARKREVAAARVKAEADAKAKAEADKKKAHPARSWVQVAAGANQSALQTDFGRLTKKYPAEFKSQKGAIAEWGRTRRLLVGPFASAKAAATWLAAYKKAGGDAFQWSSEAGEVVTPVR